MRTTRNTHIHSVGTIKSSHVLKEIVHIEPLGYTGLIVDGS
jgi:hypothetical protein